MGVMSRGMPLWRDANRLLVAIEEAVRQFPRYHKYAVGADLRRQALNVCRLIHRAANDPPNRLRHLERLVATIDDLKEPPTVDEKISWCFTLWLRCRNYQRPQRKPLASFSRIGEQL